MADRPSKEVRLAAAALLLATRHTRLALAAALTTGTQQAVGLVTVASQARRPNDGRVDDAIIVVSASMAVAFEQAIRDGRANARKSGLGRLRIEIGVRGLGDAVLTSALDSADGRKAAISGQSLANAWRVRASAEMESAIRAKAALDKRLRQVARDLGSSLDRTAETESAQAFSGERLAVARELAKTDDRFARFGRRWVALLEACPECGEHAGETVGIHESYKGGDEPGWMHPHCRCFEEFVPID